LSSFDPALFCAAPIPNQKRRLPIYRYPSLGAPASSARLCGLVPMVATLIGTRRAPSPKIGARYTPFDRAANGSAGVHSAPDMDAGPNSAPHLRGQRWRDHEDRGDSSHYRKLAEQCKSP
jgi:hypothetical protein